MHSSPAWWLSQPPWQFEFCANASLVRRSFNYIYALCKLYALLFLSFFDMVGSFFATSFTTCSVTISACMHSLNRYLLAVETDGLLSAKKMWIQEGEERGGVSLFTIWDHQKWSCPVYARLSTFALRTARCLEISRHAYRACLNTQALAWKGSSCAQEGTHYYQLCKKVWKSKEEEQNKLHVSTACCGAFLVLTGRGFVSRRGCK